MKIAQSVLSSQYQRAFKDWPWVGYVERINGLPPFLLFAVASRETNMRNIVGDGGHGIGIFQRDNRAWKDYTLPAGKLSTPAGRDWYLSHPRRQAEDAAELLKSNYRHLGTWLAACAAYNAGAGAVSRMQSKGSHPDAATTGGDYGTDVLGRRLFLVRKYGTVSQRIAKDVR